MTSSRSYVVTGGGRGVGRAVVERLLGAADTVVAIELDPAALAWIDSHPAGARVVAVVGDAADPAVADRAAHLAQAAAPLAGWVNNAAVFRDAALHRAGGRRPFGARSRTRGLTGEGRMNAGGRLPGGCPAAAGGWAAGRWLGGGGRPGGGEPPLTERSPPLVD